jgi:hypothetical protein
MERIKIATHQCVFNQDKLLLKNIENSYPFVDKIYISNIIGKYNCDIFLPKNKILEKFYIDRNEKINDLKPNHYESKIESIEINFKKAQEYILAESSINKFFNEL